MPGNVALRPATEADCELLFAWANDPATRAMSFKTAPIEHAEHVAWFTASVADPARRLFIAGDDAGAIGLVRFSLFGEHGAAEVGINLAPERRGQGLALPVLLAATEQARDLGVGLLIARIRPENAASRRAFSRAGYVLRGEEAVGSAAALRYELALRAP